MGNMKNYTIDNDIKVICITADSFPAGVAKAHQTLHGLLAGADRKFFGISYQGRDGNIIYKAAAEEKYVGEAEALHCESFLIRKGSYTSAAVNNFMADVVSVIGKTFQELLKHPGIDKNGYCLEIYLTDNDMMCLVKLNDND